MSSSEQEQVSDESGQGLSDAELEKVSGGYPYGQYLKNAGKQLRDWASGDNEK